VNPLPAKMQMVTNRYSNSDEPSRLHGHWLIVVRIAWIMCVALTLVIFFVSLPEYSAQLQTPCAGTSCWYTQLSAGQIEALKGIGLSPGVYAVYTVALTFASVVLCLVVSVLIVWRRADDRMAMLVAIMLVAFGPIYATSSIVAVPSAWRVPNECLYFLALISLVLVFLLFPSGQFVPRWTRWAFLVFLIGFVPTAFVAPAFPPYAPIGLLTSLVSLSALATIAIVQVYRYRHLSSPLQQQQTKWVVFGIAASITVVVSGIAPTLIFPVLASSGSLYPVALNAFSTVGALVIPLSFGFAMLRSRLWDIDVLVNRTLVYGTLTALLALVYFGLIFVLQYLLRGIISQHNDVAIVISTLAIAALFQPLRQCIQVIIDRRFYRRKYDAAKIVEAFSATLRNEVDLSQLREQLLAVVEETMQPEHVSLWLRSPQPPAEQQGMSTRTPQEK
jgi:hypothetical protein